MKLALKGRIVKYSAADENGGPATITIDLLGRAAGGNHVDGYVVIKTQAAPIRDLKLLDVVEVSITTEE